MCSSPRAQFLVISPTFLTERSNQGIGGRGGRGGKHSGTFWNQGSLDIVTVSEAMPWVGRHPEHNPGHLEQLAALTVCGF